LAVANCRGLANVPLPLFSRTDTLFAPRELLAVTMSGLPSPLKSPRATELGPVPVPVV
jgi:hypothetical protein